MQSFLMKRDTCLNAKLEFFASFNLRCCSCVCLCQSSFIMVYFPYSVSTRSRGFYLVFISENEMKWKKKIMKTKTTKNHKN